MKNFHDEDRAATEKKRDKTLKPKLEPFITDLRYSTRILLRNPGFTAVALLSLALGIGANATIFSVFSTTLFRTIPLKEADRLVLLVETHREQDRTRSLTHQAILDLTKQSRVFESWSVTSRWGAPSVTLSGRGKAERGRYYEVGPDIFSVVGIQPVLGRPFSHEFPANGESSEAVISHGFWQSYFGADPDVLGQTITVEGSKKTVVGVMPPGFWLYPWTKGTDLWVAFDLSKMPKLRWLNPLGRLRQGVSIEQVQAEMDVISQRFAEIDPETNEGWEIRVVPLREWAVSGDRRETLYLLMGAVGFILLIACANVANLLLARSASRQKEIAVRASMGADRLSLLRQLFTESIMLAVLGGVLGIIVGFIGIRIFVAMAPSWSYSGEEVGIDLVVLAFTLGISLLAALLFGLFPALQASKLDLHSSLKEGGRSSRVPGGRSRKILVVAEVALALVLLVGAGLMTNSFLRLQQVDPGFDPKNVLLARVTLAGTPYWYGSAERRRVTPQGVVFFKRLVERVRALPGVVSAGTANGPPPATGYSNPIDIVGRAPRSKDDPLRVQYCEVSPGFLETLGIPLLKGRYLTEQDVEGSPWVVVINEAMVNELFPNEEPLGRSLYMSMVTGGSGTIREERPREIVGVVGDVKRWNLKWGQRPLMYGSHEQHVWEYPGGRYVAHLSKDLVIRTATNPMSLAQDLQRIVSEVDQNQAVYNIRTMEQDLSSMVTTQRFWMQLYGIFAALALILAAIGIYGVMSNSVNERTHEIGVRMAVGADTGAVLRLVITQGLKLTFLGTAIGILGGFGLTRLISSYLFGVTPTDPLTYIVVSLFLAIIAVAASAFPAQRAARVDPLTALRYE